MEIENFSKHLQEVTYPTKEQENEGWHIQGCLPKFSNQICKFDVRSMIPDDKYGLSKKIKCRLKKINIQY